MTVRAGVRRATTGRGSGAAGSAASLFASAFVAHSEARALFPAYAGSLLRVRDTVTTTQTDIGQTAGALNEVALLAAVGGVNEGRVVTIYDQIGANHLTQATAGTQQRIVATGGAIDKLNSKPASIVTTANQCYRCTLAAGAVSTALVTVYFAGLASSAALSTARKLSGFTAAVADGSGVGNFGMANSSQSGANDVVRMLRSGSLAFNTTPANAVNAHVCVFRGEVARQASVKYAAGGAGASASAGTFNFDRIGWGATSTAAGIAHVGMQFGESAMWLRALTEAEVAVILADAAAFWSIV